MLNNIYGAKGGGGSPHQPVESPDSLHSTAKAKVLLCLGHGEFAGVPTDETIYLNGTPIKGADGSTNFTGVRWEFRPGTQTQDPITAFPAVESETAVNTECKANVPVTRALSNLQLTACRVRLGFPRLAKVEDNGDTNGVKVQYKIEVSTDGGAWQLMVDGVVEGKTTTLYQRQHRINLPPATRSGWQVRVTRTTPDSTSQNYVDKFNFEVLTEVIDVKLRYPGLALLYLEFDAEQFPNGIPRISCKIKGQKCWIPSNYDPVSRTYSGVWNGTLVRGWTDNPAWHAFEALQSRAWGLGRRIPAAIIDKSKWELYRIAQFADQPVDNATGNGGTEPRFLSNVYIQAQNNAFNVLRDLVATFYGSTCWTGDHLMFNADMPRDPVRAINNASVINGRFEYSFGDQKQRHSTAIVQYDDPTNHYNTVPQPVQVSELVARYGVNPVEITAIGCTRSSEAQRRGLYALYTNMDDMICNFNVGRDGLVYKAGDVVRIADAFISGRADAGGRVVQYENDPANNLVQLDRKPLGDTSNNTVIYINASNGTMQPYYFSAIASAGHVRLRKHPNGPTPNPSNIAAGATWVVDNSGLKNQLFQVLGVAYNDDGTYSISTVKYNASKQNAIDTGARLDQLPVTEIPPGWMGIPANVAITAVDFVVQGQRTQTMRVQWNAVTGAERYAIQWRKDSGDWINAGETSTLGVDVVGIYSGTYTARVRAINAFGVSSPWGVSAPVALTGRTGAPLAPTTLITSPIIGGVHLSWVFAPDTAPDTAYTELQFRPNGSAAENPLFNVVYPGNAFDHLGLAPAVYFEYRARTLDKLGNASPWTSWVVGNSATDIGDYIEGITDDFLNSETGQALVDKIDISGNAILENALANHADIQQRLVVDGQNRAQILEVRTTVSDQQQTVASLEQQVSAQRNDIDEIGAAVNTKMTAVVDAQGNATAMYSVRAGVTVNGYYYGAGMAIGVENNGGAIKSRIGFQADQFVILNGAGTASPFLIDNGNTYISSAMIKNATINAAKFTDTIQSDNARWSDDPNQRIGWAINCRNGDAWFAGNMSVSGGIYGKYGVLDNITINDTCVINGSLSANNIRGDIFAARGNGWWLQKINTGAGAYQRWDICSVELYPDFERKLAFRGGLWANAQGGSGTGGGAKIWCGGLLLQQQGGYPGYNGPVGIDVSDMEFTLPRGNGMQPIWIEIQSGFNDRTDFYLQIGNWNHPAQGGLPAGNPSNQSRPTVGGGLTIEVTKLNNNVVTELPFNRWPQGL